MRFLNSIRAALIGAIALTAGGALVAHSQGFTIPAGTQILGPLQSAGKPPVGVGCTIASGSTDMAGSCVTTAASGSITFAVAKSVAPNCIVVDRTATPVAVYAVSATAITLTTVTTAHTLGWSCTNQAGG